MQQVQNAPYWVSGSKTLSSPVSSWCLEQACVRSVGNALPPGSSSACLCSRLVCSAVRFSVSPPALNRAPVPRQCLSAISASDKWSRSSSAIQYSSGESPLQSQSLKASIMRKEMEGGREGGQERDRERGGGGGCDCDLSV